MKPPTKVYYIQQGKQYLFLYGCVGNNNVYMYKVGWTLIKELRYHFVSYTLAKKVGEAYKNSGDYNIVIKKEVE